MKPSMPFSHAFLILLGSVGGMVGTLKLLLDRREEKKKNETIGH